MRQMNITMNKGGKSRCPPEIYVYVLGVPQEFSWWVNAHFKSRKLLLLELLLQYPTHTPLPITLTLPLCLVLPYPKILERVVWFGSALFAYAIVVQNFRTFTVVIAGLDDSVKCASSWWSGGHGFDPAGSGNILSWRIIMKYFRRSFSPFRWFKKGSRQFLVKECAWMLVNHLED